MPEGMMGRKIGMTSVYRDGRQIPVTVIEVQPNPVVQVKSTEGADGYDAVQLGYGTRKLKRTTKAMQGHFSRAGVDPTHRLREFRGVTGLEVGGEVRVEELFAEGEIITVRGVSKGRGFAGVVKRHGFGGHKASHGTHESFRGPGSIGAHTWPGRVFPGKRMAGHLGSTMVTVKNLSVVEIIAEKNLVLVKGAVPGARNSLVELLKA